MEVESAVERTEALLSSEEGTWRQERDLGWEVTADRAQQSMPMGYRVCGPNHLGLKLKGVMEEGAGL